MRAARNHRLRLALVDSAVTTIDEPELVEVPFECDLRLAWHGDLASLADGSVVTSVAIEIAQRSYHFRADVREATGSHRIVETKTSPR